jgi:uncharacterized membrane protein YkvA (DUF1232 family)
MLPIRFLLTISLSAGLGQGSRQNAGNRNNCNLLLTDVLLNRRLDGEPNIFMEVCRRKRGVLQRVVVTRNWLHARTIRWARDLIFLVGQIHFLSRIIRHPMTPWPARVAAGCAVAYIFSPIQLIPTFIPLIGQLDDLLVVYVGASLVKRLTPNSVLAECEARAQSDVSWQQTKWAHILHRAKQRLSPVQRSFPPYRRFRQFALNQAMAVRTKVTKLRLWFPSFGAESIRTLPRTSSVISLLTSAFKDEDVLKRQFFSPTVSNDSSKG